MTDSPSVPPEGRPGGPAAGPAEPDFLDRLLARHTAPAAARPDAVRVRPRLAGPFERIEAVRARTAAGPEGDVTPFRPPAAPSAVPERDGPRPAPGTRSTMTERERTVVRTGRTPADPAGRATPPPVPELPLLRPAAPVPATTRPVPGPARRPAPRTRPDVDATRNAAPVPLPPGADAVPPAAVSAAPYPSKADTAAARDAVRQAAARRSARAPGQVVHVRIGRLEVTAAASAGADARPRRGGTGRREATVSLAQYLDRGREG
ncbi:hypothetical protein GCM10010145_29450 [Streptomyces ruber]|uniref:Uncharacterized protein n=2 Tax=Streptomyces TaxID=1883 RepID=A0A918EQF9_9ACTN|nr:hypothetical protein [Streptomyces ruber]GGQ57670.1 hypothetical protein GCM10010145_29450 [Streptomyces ruber]